jgi:hypothetical protein
MRVVKGFSYAVVAIHHACDLRFCMVSGACNGAALHGRSHIELIVVVLISHLCGTPDRELYHTKVPHAGQHAVRREHHQCETGADRV